MKELNDIKAKFIQIDNPIIIEELRLNFQNFGESERDNFIIDSSQQNLIKELIDETDDFEASLFFSKILGYLKDGFNYIIILTY